VSAGEADAPYLVLIPKICVKQSDACQTSVYAEWRYLQPVSVCLSSNDREENIECWQNSLSGSTEFIVDINEDLIVFLKLEENNTLLLESKLQVMDKGIRIKLLRKKRVLF
jgi:hypothetical protein